MRFGAVPLKDAAGGILAHSAALRGGRLRKGKVLNGDDLARMAAEGWQDVVVAQLGPDDFDEDRAATVLAEALANSAVNDFSLTKAATGRVNIHATAAGLVRFDPETVHAVNGVDPMITLAIVPDLHRVRAGDMVATVKIIAYGVAAAAVECAAETARGALGLARPVLRTATLIETTLGGGNLPSDKGRRAMQARLARFGIALAPRVTVRHEQTALAQAIASADSDIVLILTASATSDGHDVAPSALRHAGGAVMRFGMPVDPGNLLFLGALGATPVIGLPGCARSPALNGADWVLERAICGVPVTSADIARMGVGGLLKEIPTRPRPRDLRATTD